jgi:hypothetical protein
MYGRSEHQHQFPTPIPVNITYQTAFVDSAGKLQLRKDIYGRDAKVISMLKNPRKGRDMENRRVPRPAELCVRPTNVRVSTRRQLRQQFRPEASSSGCSGRRPRHPPRLGGQRRVVR